MNMPNWLRRLWYGRYHITINRVVSGEESITATFSENNIEDFTYRCSMVLASYRNHMIEHNQRVVLAHKSKIESLEDRIATLGNEIEAKQQALDELNERYEKRRSKVDRQLAANGG